VCDEFDMWQSVQGELVLVSSLGASYVKGNYHFPPSTGRRIRRCCATFL